MKQSIDSFEKKQGPQGPQMLSSLKSLNIQYPLKTWECAMKQSEMNSSSSNSTWQTVKNVQMDPYTTEIWPKEVNVP